MINRFIVVMFLVAVGAAGCGTSEEDIRRIVREEFSDAMQRTIVKPVDVIGPYSPAVKIGNFLFLSGQIGLDQQTGLLRSENIEAETRQVLDNLNTVLRAGGYDSTHVVSATVYLKNINDYARMNLIYGGYFQDGNYPARVTVEVSNLPRQANVEIALIAYKP
ncbi:MAG: Rid family detoxifying hydrolase [Ignavibacteria bacterium]|nr:Rid family detoxifying hydrolase [Ignavibacteria bacterium]